MPTEGMKEEAQRYRDWKGEGEAGGTEVAARRATQILSGNELAADVVIAMAAGLLVMRLISRARVSHLERMVFQALGVCMGGMGGDPGQVWASNKADRIKEIRDRTMADDLELRLDSTR